MTPDPVVRSLSSQLRTLARLAAQWADVLDTSGEASPTRVTSPPSAYCGMCGADLSKYPVSASAHVCNSSAEPVPEVIPPTTTAASATLNQAPVIFACASCGARTVWDVAGYARPWPNAMCKACYAEHRMRRDEIQDAIVGYTGVR